MMFRLYVDVDKVRKNKFNRRSAVLAWTAILMTVLIGFAALTIDLGYVKIVKGQLQNAADAAALAGASALIHPGELTGSLTQENLAQEAIGRAIQYSAKNTADNRHVSLEFPDITVGRLSNTGNLAEAISPFPPYNAIRVLIRKEAGSQNGPVNLYFAAIWGKHTTSAFATATAYLDSHMVAYRPVPGRGIHPAVPVTVKREKWMQEIVLATGDDSFGYDPVTGEITLGGDGIPEISLFPEKQKSNDSEDGAGNFGLLNVGNPNEGASTLAEQIYWGIDPDNVARQFGDTDIKFFDDNGTPKSHQISGSPGAKNSLVQLESVFKSRLGTVIGFFVHDEVVHSGSNATYTITGMQFGRVMMVNAQGSVNGQKAIVIQPVAYLGAEIITGDHGPSHATAGRVRLVR